MFDFPVRLDPLPKSLPAELLTLAYLLEPSTKFKPPFEQRLQLPISLCTTLSDLYSSGWLHKSLRSANIPLLRRGADRVLYPRPPHLRAAS